MKPRFLVNKAYRFAGGTKTMLYLHSKFPMKYLKHYPDVVGETFLPNIPISGGTPSKK